MKEDGLGQSNALRNLQIEIDQLNVAKSDLEMNEVNLEETIKGLNDTLQIKRDVIKDLQHDLKASETDNMNLKDQLINLKNVLSERDFDLQSSKEDAAK